MTAHRHALAALALAAVVAAALLPTAAAASKADAFEGKIQPVSGQLYRKAGRFELSIGTDRSLNDAFFVKGGLKASAPYLQSLDAKLGYHITDSLSLSLHGAVFAATPTPSTTVCPTGEACRSASEVELRQVPGRIRRILGAEVGWAPIYGKLNLFSEKVAHLDLSIFAGPDLVFHDEVLDATAAALQVAAGEDPAVVRAIGGHVGIGARIFILEFLALRLDLRDYVYRVRVPNGDPPNGWDYQNQLVAEVGVSYFFPMSNRRQP
jgi:outer membrane beta-barrel protein